MEKKKFGFDIHGVLDTLTIFPVMAKTFVEAGHEVHIITGAPKTRALIELREVGIEEGVHYTHFFSITDFHHKKKTPGLRYDEFGEPFLPDEVWNSTKGMYLSKNKIDMHWDDSRRYAEHCSTPYSIVTNNDNRKRVAIYGGSFNPPTNAHREVIETLMDDGFDKVIVAPSHRHGFKGSQEDSFSDRIHMSELAFEDIDGVSVVRWEENNRTGYTFDLMNLYDKCVYDFSIVIGKDNADCIDKWFKGNELKERYPFIVLSRNGDKAKKNDWFMKEPHKYIELSEQSKDVSSSLAREEIKETGNTYMVTKDVMEYIKENELYED